MKGEGAIGQWEMNWDFDNALKTADKQSFFKFMTKCVAEKHLYRATFMPKPTANSYNRTHIVRVPGLDRLDLRLPDGAVNPYLLQAIMIAAGLSGMHAQADPGKSHGIDMYADDHKVHGAPKLSLNRLDALRAFDKGKALKAAMGEDLTSAYFKNENARMG